MGTDSVSVADSDTDSNDSDDTDSDDTDSDDTDSDDTDSDDDDDSDSIDVTSDSDDDSDDTDSDSDSDEDTTDSDDNNFAAAFAAQKEAENALLDRIEGDDEETVDGVPTEGLLTVSLSKETMVNLWGIFALFTVVNVTLCVWCHLKGQKARKRVRFLEDRYDSEIPIENV